MSDAPLAAPSDVMYCTVHPTVETTLRCNKCGRPMCVKCARRTPVGYRCKECVANQQAVFYNAQSLDPVIQFAVSAVLSVFGAALIGILLGGIGFVTLLVGIPASLFAGGLIADVAHRAVSRRRGRYAWLVVGAGTVAGALVVGVIPQLLTFLLYSSVARPGGAQGMGFFLFGGLTSIGWWIYIVVATATAAGRLRFGR